MTGSELDRARAEEAMKSLPIVGTNERGYMAIAEIAAKLGREGWTPPDPLQVEIEKIEFSIGGDYFVFRDLVRKALERGIEIGKAQSVPPMEQDLIDARAVVAHIFDVTRHIEGPQQEARNRILDGFWDDSNSVKMVLEHLQSRREP